jgi:methylase of polypeptide subunit release factors
MPRLSRLLLATAWKEDTLLPLLLRSCRDLESARRELRWLKEHAIKITTKRNVEGDFSRWQKVLDRLCVERSRGRPLQYLLGSEFFGPIEIACKPGVLIPRWELSPYL